MNENKEFYKIPSFSETIFKDKVELLPSVNESFDQGTNSEPLSGFGIVDVDGFIYKQQTPTGVNTEIA